MLHNIDRSHKDCQAAAYSAAERDAHRRWASPSALVVLPTGHELLPQARCGPLFPDSL